MGGNGEGQVRQEGEEKVETRNGEQMYSTGSHSQTNVCIYSDRRYYTPSLSTNTMCRVKPGNETH